MNDQLQRLGIIVADRYVVERELGSGGMAMVYLARDLKHERPVALKVLRPELAAAIGSERFLQEIQILARLSHPHILPFYDSGEAEGLLYYVMSYVEGPSLRARLTQDGQLTLDEALQITRHVASALDYAHRQGIIHRDIKPENILLHEGEAMVVDFGIALAVSAAGGERHTEGGTYLGTPEYMSPEQASGDPQLDGRTDQYSLACVLYEMLAGQAPFVGPNPRAVMARHVTDAVPPLTTLRPGVGVAVVEAVTKGLAKVPADRFPTASEFAEALVRQSPRQLSDSKSIAVLAFANMSNDPENEYLSDGISEEIISALSKVKQFQVASRTSAFVFKGTRTDIQTIGQRLNVNTVLEGSVRKAGDRLRIAAQLISVADGYHLWSERYDREMKDVFAIQDEIAQAIVETLKGRLVGGEGTRIVKQYTDDVEAYQLYLKGRHVQNTRTRGGFAKGIEYFEQAIARDSNYAIAHAGLADTYSMLGFYRFLEPSDAFPKAGRAAGRAIELDGTLAEAHTSQGVVRFYHDWDWSGTEAAFTQALTCNPEYPTALHWYGEYLAAHGRLDEAFDMVSRAHRLDPLSPTINTGVAWVHHFSRRYDAAIDQLEKTLELNPNYVFLHWFLGQSYMLNGMYEEAVNTFRRGRELTQNHPGLSAYLAHACAVSDRRDEAVEIRHELKTRAERTYVPADYLGVVCMGLGETDEALEWFQKACRERALHMVFVGIDPLFDGLRSDPRFSALLRTLGLEDH